MLFGSAAALPEGMLTQDTSITASAGTMDSSNMYWYNDLSDGTVEISGYNGSETNIIIPVTLDGKIVTKLRDHSFGNKKMESVVIPNSVKTIGRQCFNNCENLKTVKIPDSVTYLDDYAFYSCDNLTSVGEPKGIKYIGYCAFMYCKKLENAPISSSTETISQSAFHGCKGLKSVNISGKNTVVEEKAFAYCYGLTSVTIGNGLKTIEEGTFASCESLKELKLGNGIKTIKKDAFGWCDNLESVIIPNSVTSIGEYAFSCNNLKTITIPKSVTSIDKYAFGFGPDQLTINCYKNSTAHKYAVNKEIKFAFLDNHTHKYSTWSIIRNATPTVRGVMKSECCICGTAATKPIIYFERIKGSNRYGTAVELSKKSFPNSADTVVIASGEDYHDALAAVPLAKACKAPLLLTDPKSLPTETLNEIKRLKAKKIILVYTTNQIGSAVINALKGYSIEKVTGSNFIETSVKVATRLKSISAPNTAFFVSVNGFADALSVSTIAAIKCAPIIYVNKTGDVSTSTKTFLSSSKSTIKGACVIGGTGVVGDSVKAYASKALGGINVSRIKGQNRYETCVQVNNTFKAYLTSSKVALCTGKSFPDALSGGVFAAMNATPLMLVDQSLESSQKTYLSTKKAVSLIVIGGTGALPNTTVQLVRDASI